MKFLQVELSNWALYRSTQIVQFNTTNEKPVVLINGENDKGKTSFFYGIRYALFGELGLHNHPKEEYRYLHEWANLYSAKDGDDELCVELKIQLDDGSVFRIQRKRKFFQTPTGETVTLEQKDQLTIFDDDEPLDVGKDGRAKQSWIEKNTLPIDVSQLLFVESIEDLWYILERNVVKDLVNEDVVNKMNIILEKLDRHKFHYYKFYLMDGKLRIGYRGAPSPPAGQQTLLALIFILTARNIHAPDSFLVIDGLRRLDWRDRENALKLLFENVSQLILLTPIDDPDVSKFFTQSLFLD